MRPQPLLIAPLFALFASQALAQVPRTFYPPEPPTECTVTCPEGPPGPRGIPGPPGPPGPPGTTPTGPRTLRPFDLAIRGVAINTSAVVKDGTATYLLVYSAQLKAAALIDVSTGLAQIQAQYVAGVGADPRHPGELIAFDKVEVLSPRTFAWWHHGVVWSHTWDDSLAWVPMPGWSWR